MSQSDSISPAQPSSTPTDTDWWKYHANRRLVSELLWIPVSESTPPVAWVDGVPGAKSSKPVFVIIDGRMHRQTVHFIDFGITKQWYGVGMPTYEENSVHRVTHYAELPTKFQEMHP